MKGSSGIQKNIHRKRFKMIKQDKKLIFKQNN